MVGINGVVDFFGGLFVGDEFWCCGYIDVVYIGIVHCGCGRSEIDFFGVGILSHLNDLFIGGFVNNGIVD